MTKLVLDYNPEILGLPKKKSTSASKPAEKKIGIATWAFSGIFQKIFPKAEVIQSYADAVKYDLIIFTGGEDVDPAWYTNEGNTASYVNPERDRVERAIFETAYNKRKIKFYGTCRGHQHLNVLLGGSLFQDFPSAIDIYSEKPFGRHEGHHTLDFIAPKEKESVIQKFFEGQKVVSMHHQAVRNLGNGLYPICSYKRIIEGMESSDGRIITTQFHPEFDYDETDPESAPVKFFKFLLNEW